jgi:hypothetical protein
MDYGKSRKTNLRWTSLEIYDIDVAPMGEKGDDGASTGGIGNNFD